MSKKDIREKKKVEQCRKNWHYKSLDSEISIKVLLHDKKGRYDLMSWPNFFIGVDTKGDTIGVIEYVTKSEFKKGELLTFLPGQRKNSRLAQRDSEWDIPLFVIRGKTKENDLYCAVKLIYYGKLKK